MLEPHEQLEVMPLLLCWTNGPLDLVQFSAQLQKYVSLLQLPTEKSSLKGHEKERSFVLCSEYQRIIRGSFVATYKKTDARKG